jgi:hypothetical protein
VVSRVGGEAAADNPVPPDQRIAPRPAERELAQAPGSGPEPGGFDATVVHRATRALEAGRSWNAFTVRPAPPPPELRAEPPEPAGSAPEPAAAGPPAQWPLATPPATPAVAEHPAAPNGEAAADTAALRRRVPGATLTPSMPTTRPRPGPPAASRRPGQPSSASDPAEARELVEQLQTGVMRALNEMQSDDGPAT